MLWPANMYFKKWPLPLRRSWHSALLQQEKILQTHYWSRELRFVYRIFENIGKHFLCLIFSFCQHRLPDIKPGLTVEVHALFNYSNPNVLQPWPFLFKVFRGGFSYNPHQNAAQCNTVWYSIGRLWTSFKFTLGLTGKKQTLLSSPFLAMLQENSGRQKSI